MDIKPCSMELPGQPMDCCISSSAPLIASGLVDGQIVLHRYEAAQPQTTEDEEASVCSTSYSASQVLARSSKKGASCRAVCFAADGQTLLAGFATGSILQLDSGTGKVVARMTKAHSAGINRMLALSGQQQLLAAGDDSGNISIWDLRSQESVYQYKQHTDFISGLAQHHTSGKQQQDMLVAVSGDGTLSVHDLRSRQLVARSETDADDELLSVAVCKSGKKIVCGSQSGVLALWSWGYWNDCSDRFPGHPESVDALVKYDEDTVITGSSDGLLRVVNILPNKLIAVLGAHADDLPVERLALSADRAVLASMSHDSCVKLWDMSILQDDEGDTSEWEEADSEEAAELQDTPAKQESAPPAAAAEKQGQNERETAAAGTTQDSDSDSDSDEPKTGGKRKRRDKTAMRKGGGKPKPGGNFFADLL